MIILLVLGLRLKMLWPPAMLQRVRLASFLWHQALMRVLPSCTTL